MSSNKILTLCLVLISFIYCADSYCVQGTEWIEFNGNCYQWSRTEENWFRAQLTCQQYGGHLVSIGGRNENDFLQRLTQCSSTFWIGLVNTVPSMKTNSRGYEWWDGSQHNYTSLDARNNVHYDCVYSDRTGKWYNFFCDRSLKFVCMAPAVSGGQVEQYIGYVESGESENQAGWFTDWTEWPTMDSTTEAPTEAPTDAPTDESSTMQPTTMSPSTIAETSFPTTEGTESPIRCPPNWYLLDNSCYFVSSNSSINYFHAQISCQSMGASVVSLSTRREHLMLTLALGCNSPAWIGLEKARPCTNQPTDEDHCWEWMDQSPVTYLDWAPGQTLDRRDAECVVIDGQFKVVNCYSEYRYICKKSV